VHLDKPPCIVLDATAGHSVEYLFTQPAQRPSIKIPPTQFLIRYYKYRIGFEMNRLQDSWDNT